MIERLSFLCLCSSHRPGRFAAGVAPVPGARESMKSRNPRILLPPHSTRFTLHIVTFVPFFVTFVVVDTPGRRRKSA